MIEIVQGNDKLNHFELPSGLSIRVSEEGNIHLYRDFYSSIPLFYFSSDNGLVISDSYLELSNFLKENVEQLGIDRKYINWYIAFQTPVSSHTLLEGLRRLRPGECVLINKLGNINSEFVHNVRTSSQHYTNQELRSRLDAIIKNLNPTDTAFHISSGLDSSILAIRAAKVFSDTRVNLATCLTRGNGCSNELKNAERLAKDIDANFVAYDFTDIDIFKEGESLIKECLGYPVAHPSHLVEYLLNKRIVASGAKTIVNGKGPDDCLAGYSWHLDEFEKVEKHKSRLTVTSDVELFEITGGSVDLRAEGSIWRELSGKLSLNKRLEHDARAITDAWNIIHTSIARSLKVKVESPFMDPLLRSGLFSLPDNQKINKLQQKIFLRKTFAEDYPKYILDFSKHGFRLDLQPYFMDYSSDELYLKITRNMPWVEFFFNPKKIKMMIDSTLSGERNYGWQLWSVFCLITAINS